MGRLGRCAAVPLEWRLKVAKAETFEAAAQALTLLGSRSWDGNCLRVNASARRELDVKVRRLAARQSVELSDSRWDKDGPKNCTKGGHSAAELC